MVEETYPLRGHREDALMMMMMCLLIRVFSEPFLTLGWMTVTQFQGITF